MTVPYYQDGSVTVLHGDCLDVLRELPDNSVDAVVTDPPYGLEFMGKQWDAPWKTAATVPEDPDEMAVDGICSRCGEPVGDVDQHYRKRHPDYLKQTPWRNESDADRAYVEANSGTMSARMRARPVFIAGAGFQQWCELWAAECLRVLKPGGHMLSFGGTRTWHRLVCAIEDAGFEIRDSIAWLYGSGFPKSLDVSKAIDKAAPRVGMFDGFARHFSERLTASGLTQKEVSAHFPSKTGGLTGCVWNWANGANVPTREQWLTLAPMLGLSADWLPLIERIEADREVTGSGTSGRTYGMGGLRGVETSTGEFDVTAPATEAAQQWQGWGTALKPAHEPIVVARKPLRGTVAANVQEHGTGALNIDGCRIGTTDNLGRDMHTNSYYLGGATVAELEAMDPDDLVPSGTNTVRSVLTRHYKAQGIARPTPPAGRWPANVILDSDQAAALDEMSGESSSPPVGSVARTQGGNTIGTFAHEGREPSPNGHGDSGGASRFFLTVEDGCAIHGIKRCTICLPSLPIDTLAERFTYTAKAGSDERITHNGTAHPTVKPLTLMRWLVRLVTPPGGTILEPFAGSGTTVEAAILEGFKCIAIEREADYLPLITQRIHRRRDPVAYLTEGGHELGLFGEDEIA